MSLTALLVPSFKHMLQTLTVVLDKAEKQAPDRMQELLMSRLAPDMHPLWTQICFVAYQAQDTVFRLKGEDKPESLQVVARQGREADANTVSLAKARAFIKDASTFLDTLGPDELDDAATRMIALALPNGAAFDLNGEQFARDWALPQSYFHATTAYAILRNHGIGIGKADFVSHMAAYARPAPQSKG
ncbi:DUF1993 domain-containing protein [Allorhizobium taibaishanense]|uniref:DUF1993 domain-containing protein n=1 Tax=Allorhizobium taibaishanense TaxID=887144 RepID=A0A1Q9A428_9HYPH|nr:DUF1993 domain-containing protein [Allorhizobium taibaishanense]MBB4006380.1 hypothetical protein [Allorhizobium taibaishanense]OLP49329.1 hypothetical protein BJF91_19965 [Allorhizobium taibaishanense]